MTTTANPPARSAHPPALLLRALAIALLLAGAGGDAFADNVSITSIQQVASEASLTTAVVQFNRDSNSGPLVVLFSLSGTATSTNSPTLPTYIITSSATVIMASPYATSGTITIADGHSSEQPVITPLDNSAITGDLPLVVTVQPDPSVYTVVQGASAAQIDIAEGDYQASVVVPAPVAYEDTSKVGTSADPGAPRRGILRVAFSPITTFPGSTTAPGLGQFHLSPTSGTPPAAGAPLTIAPTATGGSILATSTTTLFGAGGSSFLAFTPGISVGIPVGSLVTAPGFSGTISLVPPPAGQTLPLYDKALKVQFGGSAALPSAATGAMGGTGTDTYYVSYKIGGSAMGSVTNPVTNGMGWNVVAYPGTPATPGTTTINLGSGTALPSGTQIYFNGNTTLLYTLTHAYAGGARPDRPQQRRDRLHPRWRYCGGDRGAELPGPGLGAGGAGDHHPDHRERDRILRPRRRLHPRRRGREPLPLRRHQRHHPPRPRRRRRHRDHQLPALHRRHRRLRRRQQPPFLHHPRHLALAGAQHRAQRQRRSAVLRKHQPLRHRRHHPGCSSRPRPRWSTSASTRSTMPSPRAA